MFVSNGDMPPAMAYVGLAALEQPGFELQSARYVWLFAL